MEGLTSRRRGKPTGASGSGAPDYDPVLSPRSIALIGASERTYFGRNIFRNLWEHHFPGPIHLVNARRSTIFGEPAVPSVRHIGAPVDQAIILAGQEHLPAILDDCAATGVKSAVILSSLEQGDIAGGRLKADIARKRAQMGIQVLGSSSLGYINVRDRLPATVTHLKRLPPAGPLAVLSHSGAFMITALRLLDERNAGASFLVSLGNELDLDLCHYLRKAIEDPGTRVVALILEGVRRPAELMELAAQALAAGKYIVALKLGKSEQGRELALSHTGALVGSHEAFEAVCRRYGIVLAEDFDELIDLSILFGQLPPSDGKIPRVGVTVASGGAGLLAADAAGEYGIPLPKLTPKTTAELEQILPIYAAVANPLDTTAQVRTDSEMFERATTAFAADENIDILMFPFALGLPEGSSTSHTTSFEQVAWLKEHTDKPVIAAAAAHQTITAWGRQFLKKTGMPYVRGVKRAFRGLHAWTEHGKARLEQAQTMEYQPVRVRPFERPDSGALTLDEWNSKQRLLEYGLRGPREAPASSPAEAIGAANEIGYPVAMKVLSANLPHKAAVGGVALDIRSDDDLMARWFEMERAILPLLPANESFRVLVSEMVRGGVELLLGVHTDPQYGPLVACGPGGTFAEAIGRVALAVPPLSEAQVWELLDQAGVGRLLRSEQRGHPLDAEAAVRAVQAVGQFAVDHRGLIDSLDINPLVILPRGEGACVLDALLVLPQVTREEAEQRRARKKVAAVRGGS